MTLADDISLIFDDVAPVFADAFAESSYQLLGRVSDGNGGYDDTPIADLPVVESGRCIFGPASQFGGSERSEMDLIVTLSPYSAELPKSTIATDDHLIRITNTNFGSRVLLIDDVKRGGNWELFCLVSLSEHTDG